MLIRHAALLALTATVVAGLRCEMDEQCGEGGVCDQLLRCCRVRGCSRGCPAGQVCLTIGWTVCGKFSKLVDTCACPRKLGCVPLSEMSLQELGELPSEQLPQVPARPSDRMPMELRGLMLDGVSNGVPDGVPNGVPNGVPDGVPDGVPGQVSEEISEWRDHRDWLDMFYDM